MKTVSKADKAETSTRKAIKGVEQVMEGVAKGVAKESVVAGKGLAKETKKVAKQVAKKFQGKKA